jgi:hypothetical protein
MRATANSSGSFDLSTEPPQVLRPASDTRHCSGLASPSSSSPDVVGGTACETEVGGGGLRGCAARGGGVAGTGRGEGASGAGREEEEEDEAALGVGRERGARPSSSMTNLSLGSVEEEEEEEGAGAGAGLVAEAVEAGVGWIEEDNDDADLAPLAAVAAVAPLAAVVAVAAVAPLAAVAILGGGKTSDWVASWTLELREVETAFEPAPGADDCLAEAGASTWEWPVMRAAFCEGAVEDRLLLLTLLDVSAGWGMEAVDDEDVCA